MASGPQPPIDSPTAARFGRFGFSLRGLMVFTFGAAVGSTALRVNNAHWFDALLAAVLAWFVLGLLNQARDLWTAFHGRAGLSPDERWGWRFACGWRVAMAGLLAGCYLVEHLVKQKYLDLPNSENWLAANLRPILVFVCLFVVLKSTPRLIIKRSGPTFGSRFTAVAGCIAAVLVGMLVVINITLVPFLVHIAIEGVRHAFYPRFVAYGGNWVRPFQAARFFWWSLLAAAVALGVLGLVGQLNWIWSRGQRWRWIFGILAAISISVPAYYVFWLSNFGLHELSPAMDEVRTIGPPHRWFTALLLVIVLVTAASYRLVARTDESGGREVIPWRRGERSYYHERPAVVALLAIALILQFVRLFYEVFGGPFSSRFFSAFELAGYTITEPRTLIIECVILVAIWSAFTGWFRLPSVQAVSVTKLPLPKFCAIWVALFIAVIVTIPTLAGFSFACWLNPWWFHWSWP